MTKQELETCIGDYGKDIYSFCKHLTNNPKSYLLSIALRIWKTCRQHRLQKR